MSGTLDLITLSEEHVDQVNQFLRNNAFTEPVIATFNGDKPVEGTVLEERGIDEIIYFSTALLTIFSFPKIRIQWSTSSQTASSTEF